MEENNNEENNPIQNDKVKKPVNGKMIIAIVVIIVFIIAVIIAGVYIYSVANEEEKEADDKKSKIADEDEDYDYEDDDYYYDDEDYYYEDDEDYYDDYYYTSNELAEIEENLVIEKIGETEYGEIVFSIKNNNNETVYIDYVYIILKDENGTFVDKVESAISYFAIAGNSEVLIYSYEGGDEIPEYSNYEFQIKLDEYKDDYLIVENFEVSSTDNGSSIAVEVVNNNDFSVSSIELGIIYYKDGEVVGVNYGYDDSTVKSGSSAYIILDYAYDSDFEDLTDFDDYEIYIYYALNDE